MDNALEVLTGLPFDVQRPPTRVYISGYTYRLAAPRFPHLPLANTVKVIANWLGPASKIAKNIWYLLFPTGVDTTVGTFLTDVANQVMTSWVSSTLMSNISTQWQLQNVEVHDNASSSGTVGHSTHAPIPGTGGPTPYPPQVAVVISWPITASYRGGKPRWYIPGLYNTATTIPGDSVLPAGLASLIQSAAATFRTNLQAAVIDTFSPTLGTISYQSGHSPRPTPLFRPFGVPRVHERLDSQRRRSGKESAVGSVP